MITGNKGEWSEIYTLLKVLSDKQIYAGDGDLNRIESLIFPVIKVLRDESNGTFEFIYDNDLILIKNDIEEFRISISEFKKQAHFLLSKLQSKTERTFSVPEIESFMKSFNSDSIKAKSTVKSDIRIIIHDQRTGTTPELGFSIKSQLGGASTLLNAGKTTNFIYKINKLKLADKEIEEINIIETKSKLKDRLARIFELGGALQFIRPENSIFENNLILIDSNLPKMIGESLQIFFSSSLTKTSDLVNKITEVNPLGYNLENNHPFYEYKFKRFLTDVALGMMPSQVWTGELDTTGGYLIVKEDGEILCYHIYNRNEFEDYLMNNTKLETASTTRHGFGEIYRDNGGLNFKLNLQIRFIK